MRRSKYLLRLIKNYVSNNDRYNEPFRNIMRAINNMAKTRPIERAYYHRLLLEKCQYKTEFDMCGMWIRECDLIKYAIQRGGDNYSLWFLDNFLNIEVLVLLINMQVIRKEEIIEPYLPIFLDGGAGYLLIMYPKLIDTPNASPYLERRAIIAKLTNELLHNIIQPEPINIIIDYLPWEIMQPTFQQIKVLNQRLDDKFNEILNTHYRLSYI